MSSPLTSPCVVSCAQQAATAAGCEISNTACLCASAEYQIKAVSCLETNCPAELTAASQLYDADCADGASFGFGTTTVSSTSAFATAGAATSTSSAGGSASGSSGSSGASTGGSGPTSNEGGSKVSVGLIAGAAAGGVAALFIIGILIFFIWRRNRNARRQPPPRPAAFVYTQQAGAEQMPPAGSARPHMQIASDASLRPLTGAFAAASIPSTRGAYTLSDSGYATVASSTPSPPPAMPVVAPLPILHEPRPRAPIALEPPPRSPVSTRESGAWTVPPTSATSPTYPADRKRAPVVLSADSQSGSSSAPAAAAPHATPTARAQSGEHAEEEAPPPMYEDTASPV